MRPYYHDEAAGITIFRGDCLRVLPNLPPVDVAITDPPYSENVMRKARRGDQNPVRLDGEGNVVPSSFSRKEEFEFDPLTPKVQTFVAGWFGTRVRRWSLVFSDVEIANTWRDALTAAKLEHVRTGAWIKKGATPQFTGDRPAVGFEAVTIAHPKGAKRWNGGGRHAVWTHAIVLNRSHTDPRMHGAQKPEPLMIELVSLFTEPGELVIDPFMGSGTTLAACKRLGRRCIGIEKRATDCRKAADRLDAITRVSEGRRRA